MTDQIEEKSNLDILPEQTYTVPCGEAGGSNRGITIKTVAVTNSRNRQRLLIRLANDPTEVLVDREGPININVHSDFNFQSTDIEVFMGHSGSQDFARIDHSTIRPTAEYHWKCFENRDDRKPALTVIITIDPYR
ncbi:hypothetical protein [Aliamphritea hakodatensis]|uniref:hypothetical protein n=1 Tax=Aliamphritea hakodatensis TaxID=2895352 RepID=UPI0022FD8C81|nr:hypothetical protein [Aliamphritea hakodatensis]